MNHIQHLYWRAGFGLSPAEWQQKQQWSVARALDELFAQAKAAPLLSVPALELNREDRQMNREAFEQRIKEERRRVLECNVDWVSRMADPATPALAERMAFFWHGHFACRSESSKLAIQQLNVLRQHGLGNLRNLLLGIARDPAMIRYLNNQQNRKDQPNENFARELLELFTLGRGHYTERDIKEAARAFTGWSSTLDGTYAFRPGQHDYGQKTFMGKTGNFNGEDIIDIVLEKPQTATFIVTKIYRHFVNETPHPGRIDALARQFFQSGYEIAPLMRSIFSSDWFYALENVGAKIKSPIELIAGMMRTLHLQLEQPMGLIFLERALGQILFNPPNVAGWPGGRIWIDNSTLLTRLSLPSVFFQNTEITMRVKDELEATQAEGKLSRRLVGTLDTQSLLGLAKGVRPAEQFQQLANYLLATPARVEVATLTQGLDLANPNVAVAQLTMRLMSLPEYQLC